LMDNSAVIEMIEKLSNTRLIDYPAQA